MPYDPAMVDRIRDLLHDAPSMVEKKMFGGVGFMIGGHMAAGAHSDGRLLVRCNRENTPIYAAEPGAGQMMRGDKGMTGWLLIDADAVESDQAMAKWVGRGRAHAQSMPPK